jgi:hypothetical protein
MAARSEAWVCGRSIAGLVGSNPAGGVDVWLLCVVRSVRRAGHSSRNVQPTVVYPMSDREATWAGIGSKLHRKGGEKKKN